MHPIQIHSQKTLTTLGAASLGLSALILTAAPSAAQGDNALTTPTPGSTFDYAWDYGQIDRFTVLSVEGDQRYRLDSDYEGDGEFDDWSIQYYQLGGRLWLSSLNPEYAIVYAPIAGDAMPTEINDGDRFIGRFTQFASDGFADWSGTFDEVQTTCDYSYPAEATRPISAKPAPWSWPAKTCRSTPTGWLRPTLKMSTPTAKHGRWSWGCR